MRKTAFIFLFILIPAISFSLIPDRVIIGTGNDLLSMGLSRNDDDQLSFSLNSQVVFGKKSIQADYNSITNRGWRNGWSTRDESLKSSEPVYRGRFDELIITGSRLYDFKPAGFTMEIEGSLGLYINGNLGSEVLQNKLHNVLAIHNLSIPYDSPSFVIRPVASADALIEIDAGNLSFGMEAECLVIPTVRTTGAAYLNCSLFGFDIGFGYEIAHDYSKSKTDDLYCNYLNGTVLNLGFDSGLVNGQYKTCLSTGYGYGKIGVDIISLIDKTSSSSDMKFSLGLKRQMKNTWKTFAANYQIKDRMSLVFSDSFITGEPEDPELERISDLSKTPRTKWNNAFISAGLQFQTGQSGFLKLYGSVSAGVYKMEKTILNTTLDNSEVPCETQVKKISPFGEIKAGVHVRIARHLEVDAFGGLSFIAFSDEWKSPFYGIAVTL